MRTETTNIWINRAGPSRIHAMRMLHNNPDDHPVKIFATRQSADAPIRSFADHFEIEPRTPDASDEEYAAFALDFVRRHDIKVIIPTARMSALGLAREQLKEFGCTLMVAPPQVSVLADSKSGTYEFAQKVGVAVPPFYTARTADEFRRAVAALQGAGHLPCLKPDTGWAPAGFRVVKDDPWRETIAAGKMFVTTETYATAMERAAEEDGAASPVIVMPYLDDPEWSVDILASVVGRPLLTVPREKYGWYRTFRDEPQITKMAQHLVSHMQVPYLSNVQFRYLDGEAVLLEINPRPSAGTFHTEATGVNMYWEAVKYALTGEKPEVIPQLGGRIFLHENIVHM